MGSPKPKLSMENAIEIRNLYKNKEMTIKQLSKKYEVSLTLIQNIIKKHIYR